MLSAKMFCCLTKSGIKDVNNKGGDVLEYKNDGLTNPTIDIAGKYALLADLDGNNSLNLYGYKWEQYSKLSNKH